MYRRRESRIGGTSQAACGMAEGSNGVSRFDLIIREADQ